MCFIFRKFMPSVFHYRTFCLFNIECLKLLKSKIIDLRELRFFKITLIYIFNLFVLYKRYELNSSIGLRNIFLYNRNTTVE